MTLGGDIAAQLHRNMCDHPGFGYSWAERYGGPEIVVWTVAGRSYAFNVGDYDCSSSAGTVWRKILEGTPFEGVLDGAPSTHYMKDVYLASGLFEWWDWWDATPGDLMLNSGYHVAVAQPYGELSEFSSNEYGGAYGGQRGDQTGWESHVCSRYNYPWDGCLHYNGGADKYLTMEDDMKRIFNGGGKVYRLYDPKSGKHMLTLDENERNVLVGSGWGDEGVAFAAPRGGTSAVFRMLHPNSGGHFFTADFDEAAGLQDQGWKYEGVQWFGKDNGSDVFRLYNPNGGDHFWTASAKERDDLKKAGWQYEGVAWRV